MSTYSLLVADVTVQAITTEIHNGQAPQSTTAPYVVIETISVNPENHLTELSTTDNSRLAIRSVGTTQQQSVALYKACRAALENDGLIDLVAIYGELDEKSMLYETLFDYSVWDSR